MKPVLDKKLEFNEEKHEYSVEGRKLQSVTNWIKSFSPPFKVFDAQAQAERSNESPNSKYYQMGVDNILKQWASTGEDGTAIHKQIELYLNGELPIEEITDNKAGWGCNYAEALCRKYTPLMIVPELRIYSEELGLAGTIDLFILTTKGAILCDWKTNAALTGTVRQKPPKKYTELLDNKIDLYTMQLSTYAYILEKYYGIKIHKLLLVHLKENKSEGHTVPYCSALVKQMLKVKK